MSTDDTAAIVPVERALIGACLFPGVKIPPLLSDEFVLDRHRLIWASIQGLLVLDGSVSMTSVSHDLDVSGNGESAGGPAYLTTCFEEAHVEAYVQPLARQVRESARARALERLGAELTLKGLSEGEVQARLAELPGAISGPLFDPAEEWRAIVESWRVGRIKTGFTGLDAITSGFGAGDFVVVGGRTSYGKTSWLCALTLHIIGRGVPVEYITLEESGKAITRRLIGNRIGVSIRRLKDGSVDQLEFDAAEGAVRWLQEQPLTITDLEHIRTVEEESVVGAVARSTASVVILDHLQQVTTGSRESRVYGLDRVLKRLQASALRDNKVVILAAQLGRDVDTRKGPPVLSDLRDSGGIEMAGRQVYLLDWPWKRDRTLNHQDYDLYVAKHSDGGTGVVTLRYEAHIGRFHDR